jgi:hypothetical protein
MGGAIGVVGTSVCCLDFFVGVSVVENWGLHAVDNTTGLVRGRLCCQQFTQVFRDS